jgi:hypothetical protein
MWSPERFWSLYDLSISRPVISSISAIASSTEQLEWREPPML